MRTQHCLFGSWLITSISEKYFQFFLLDSQTLYILEMLSTSKQIEAGHIPYVVTLSRVDLCLVLGTEQSFFYNMAIWQRCSQHIKFNSSIFC